MTFKKEIEFCLEQIGNLEASFRGVKEQEIIPLSFFSSNYDRLSALKQCLHNIEEAQYLQMQEHLNKRDIEEEQGELSQMIVPQSVKAELPKANEIENIIKEPVAAGFLGDKIAKTLYADIKKSLSLNDSFRFQRELFAGNLPLMETTLNHLNDFHSLPDAIAYLKTHLAWNWDDEIVCDFVKILEKRFS